MKNPSSQKFLSTGYGKPGLNYPMKITRGNIGEDGEAPYCTDEFRGNNSFPQEMKNNCTQEFPPTGYGRLGLNINKYMKITNGNITELKLAFWNCAKGFVTKGKKAEIADYMNRENISIMGIAEAEFHKTEFFYPNLMRISGYKTVLPKSWTSFNRTRLVVYIKDEIMGDCTVLEELMTYDQPDIQIELCTKTNRHIRIIYYYREYTGINGQSTLASQIDRLEKHVEQVAESAMAGDTIWIGDMNMEHRELQSRINWDKLHEIYDTLILDQGLEQVIREVTRTRITANTREESLIDHIYSNKMDDIVTTWNLPMTSSDHNLVGLALNLNLKQNTCQTNYRNFKTLDKAKLNEKFNRVDWDRVYLEEDLDKATENLTNIILSTYNKLAPVRIMKPIKPSLLNKEIRRGIACRNKALKKAVVSKSQEDISQYRKLRNKVAKLLNAEKKKKDTENMSKQKNAWRLLKEITGKCPSSGGPPTQITEGNKKIKEPKKLANYMNKYFIEKINKSRAEIDKQEIPYQATEHLRKHLLQPVPKFSLSQTNTEEVGKLIKSMNNSSGVGTDKVSNKMIKLGKDALAGPITHILNRSITEGYFPLCWRSAKVVPLHKKSCKNTAKNYRPISLVNKLSLILEALLHKQITNHFIEHKLFHENQNGFIRNRSTVTCLATTMDRWARAANQQKFVGILCLDMTSAFDLIDHKTLLDKLEILGFSQNTCKWIESYLSQRTQKVIINNCYSSSLPVDLGIPQGSKLGPLMFIIYTMDMGHSPSHSIMDSYADDSTCFIADRDPHEVNRKICEDAHHIEKWVCANKLLLAPQKSEYILASSRGKTRSEEVDRLQISVSGTLYSQSKSIKLLGLIINRNLDFTNYIYGDNNHKGLQAILSQRINMIKEVKNCSQQTILALVNGIVMGKLLYCIQVYGGLLQGQTKQMQKIVNRAARLASGLNRGTPTPILMKRCNWLTFTNMVAYHSLSMLFQIRLTGSPAYLAQQISKPRSRVSDLIPDYDANQLLILKNTFLPRTAKLWNILSLEIRSSMSVKEFKKKLWKHLEMLTETNTELNVQE